MSLKVSKISKEDIKSIILYYSKDYTATFTSSLVGVNRNTVNRYFNKFRESLSFYVEHLKNLRKESRTDHLMPPTHGILKSGSNFFRIDIGQEMSTTYELKIKHPYSAECLKDTMSRACLLYTSDAADE